MDLEDANPSDVYVCGSGKKLTRDANIVERLSVVVQKLHATMHHKGIRKSSQLHHYSRLALCLVSEEWVRLARE